MRAARDQVQLTKDELGEIIKVTIEQKLLELLGDPDEGLPIRKSVRDRLLRQKQAVAACERGRPLEDMMTPWIGGLADEAESTVDGI